MRHFLMRGMRVWVRTPLLKGRFKFVEAIPEGIIVRVKLGKGGRVAVGHGGYVPIIKIKDVALYTEK